jgi:hypothetical protein
MIYELVIEDENIDEVFAISLVETPAIESNFVFFDKENVEFAALSDEKRLLMGPILIPNKQILRIDGEGKPYHVFFKPETIKKLSEMYLKKKYTDKSTLEHDKKLNGVTLVESWIKESVTKDKSALYNLNVPVGSWLGTFKIDNDEIWNDYVKTGEVKGFSIEGLFGHNLVSAALVDELYLNKEISDLSEEEAAMLLTKIRTMFESYSDYGEGIRNNAKRGIELNEKNGNKCATQVGKVRAQAIANGEKLSVDVIKRMYSYLSRAEVYYDESDTEACGTISYLLWGGKAALSWSRNKLRELGVLEEAEQPSIPNSSYPGEAASGSIAPATFAVEGCPEATQNIKLNIENRQKAIDEANYGPINPNEPNEDYWKAKADQFKGNVEEAKKALCGNCAFFYRTPQILKCIADGLGEEVDPYEAIDAGEIGYCDAFDFKCAASRTCSAWVIGGPITMAEVGPRGGIKESPKAPKSDTKNPNPKGEGTAKGDASGKSAKVTVEQEKTLQGKVDEFNEKESNTKNGRATLGQLKSVFQRGLGAFNTSHSPLVKSASQWAFARVNAYLYLLKNGRPENPKYDTDFDLLPKGHPKAK